MKKSIEERIEEVLSEGDFLSFSPTKGDRYGAAKERLIARNDKRLADLEAVRDGKAVEVYATALVGGEAWYVYDRHVVDPFDARPTILRAIARRPDMTTDEVEAESGDA